MSRLIRSTIAAAALVGLVAAAVVSSPALSGAQDGEPEVTVGADVSAPDPGPDSSSPGPIPPDPSDDDSDDANTGDETGSGTEGSDGDGTNDEDSSDAGDGDEVSKPYPIDDIPDGEWPIDEWPGSGWTMSVAIDDIDIEGDLAHSAYLSLTHSTLTPGGLTSPYLAVSFAGIDQDVIDWFTDQEDPVDADVVVWDDEGEIAAIISLVDLTPAWLDVDLSYPVPRVLITFEGAAGDGFGIEPFSGRG